MNLHVVASTVISDGKEIARVKPLFTPDNGVVGGLVRNENRMAIISLKPDGSSGEFMGTMNKLGGEPVMYTITYEDTYGECRNTPAGSFTYLDAVKVIVEKYLSHLEAPAPKPVSNKHPWAKDRTVTPRRRGDIGGNWDV